MEKYILPKDLPFITLIIYRSRFIVIINKSTGVYPQTVFQSDKSHRHTHTHSHISPVLKKKWRHYRAAICATFIPKQAAKSAENDWVIHKD